MKLIPKKSLGQHFLNSKHVLDQIISAANIKKDETVLEIGPGTGILTEALLGAEANVIAVEKDRRAIELLNERFLKEISDNRLNLIDGDILNMNIDKLLPASGSQLPASYAIIANIPYYITGAILERFLEHEPRPDRMILLVQKEVADRIVAKDGKESMLSISVKAFGTPKIVAKVPRGAFTPAPNVDSAILAITDISATRFEQNRVNISDFFKIVRAGFAHKRKILKRNLEAIAGAVEIDNAWQKIGLQEKSRAEDMPIENWLKLAISLTA